MLPMIVLAGGLATRMRPITDKLPKSVWPVNGQPFVNHQLRLLREKGIAELIFCVGHLGNVLENHVKDGSAFNLRVRWCYDGTALLGTGGAARKAAGLLSGAFFVLYGDSYLDIDYTAVERAYVSSGQSAMMTVYRNEGLWDTSNVIYEQGRLIRYSKKEKSPDMRYIDYGLSVLTREAFANYGDMTIFDLADVYESLSEQGKLGGFEVSDRFYEIGSPEGLRDLEKYLHEKGQ
jgi:NDP-sugar pyrophosphorylase family protein